MEKYTKEFLEKIVKDSINYSDVVRKLGLSVVGSSHSHISKKIKKFEIDTSHFKSYGFSKGKEPKNKKHFTEILIYSEKTYREHGHILRRALIESGREYKCSICNNDGTWNSNFLILEVDHINQDMKDNRKENLRFLCPNCHSQNTDSQKIKNRKNPSFIKRVKLLRK